MTQVSEITDQRHTSQEVPKTSMLGVGMTFARMLLENPAALKKCRVMGPDEERYVRPPRQYELPPFRENMESVSYTHLRAHETGRNLVCRLLLEKKKKNTG